MKQSHDMIAVLSGTWHTSLVVLLFCATLLPFAANYFLEQQQVRQQQYEKRMQVSQRLLTVREQQRLIRHYQPLYQLLLHKTQLNRQAQHSPVSVIEQLQQKFSWLHLSHGANSKQPNTGGVTDEKGLLPNLQSTHIEMDLQHEGDLLQVLNAIHAAAEWSILRECHIERLRDESMIEATKLHASCTLDWLALAPLLAQTGHRQYE